MAAQNKSDKLITRAIVVLGVFGLVYFSWQAFDDLKYGPSKNPFEYNIDTFKEDGTEQVSYDQVSVLALNIESPYAITIDDFNTCFVAGDKQVVVFDSTGQKIAAWPIDGQATCIASDSGRVLVGLLNKIEILNSNGIKAGEWNEFGEEAILTSIAAADDYIYAADAGQLLVWQMDKKGRIVRRIGEKNAQKDIDGFIIPSPYFDVAIGTDGFLWAVNTGMHQFENFYPNGDLRSTWSKTSMRIDGFSGCCNPSHIAVLPDGSFVTSEKGIPRVKIHNQNGELATVVASANQFDSGTVGLDLAVDSKERIFVLDPKREQVRVFQKKETE